jgi:hypothetical protein
VGEKSPSRGRLGFFLWGGGPQTGGPPPVSLAFASGCIRPQRNVWCVDHRSALLFLRSHSVFSRIKPGGGGFVTASTPIPAWSGGVVSLFKRQGPRHRALRNPVLPESIAYL